MLTRGTEHANRTKIRDLTLTAQDMVELERSADELDLIELYMEDRVFDGKKMIRLALANGAEVIIVDTYNLMDDKGSLNEALRQTEIARRFIQARNDLGLTIIVVYQLNDDGKQLSSRNLYRDCDLVIEVEQPEDPTTNKPMTGFMTLEVIVNRNGPAGAKAEVAVSPAHSRLEEVVLGNTLDIKQLEALI
jgi:replicative DNA helicase